MSDQGTGSLKWSIRLTDGLVSRMNDGRFFMAFEAEIPVFQSLLYAVHAVSVEIGYWAFLDQGRERYSRPAQLKRAASAKIMLRGSLWTWSWKSAILSSPETVQVQNTYNAHGEALVILSIRVSMQCVAPP